MAKQLNIVLLTQFPQKKTLEPIKTVSTYISSIFKTIYKFIRLTALCKWQNL